MIRDKLKFNLLIVLVGLFLVGFFFSYIGLPSITGHAVVDGISKTKVSNLILEKDTKDYDLIYERQKAEDWIDSLKKSNNGGPGWIVVNDAPDTYHGYVYDNAMAIIAYTMSGDYSNAKDILNFLKLHQTEDGAFYDMMYTNGVSENGARHSGNQAWTLYAIAFYMYETGDFGASNSYLLMAEDTAAWLIERQESDGGITGGIGSFSGNELAWTSTEHNIDSYFAFKLFYYLPTKFSSLSFNTDYLSAMNECKRWILDEGWNYYENRFNRGENDPYKSLDTQTLGSLFLADINETIMQYDVINFAQINLHDTTSRTVGTNNVYYEGFKENEYGNHWLEGTMQMSTSYIRRGLPGYGRLYLDEVIKSDDPAYTLGHPNEDNDGDGGKQYYMEGPVIGEQPGTVLWMIFAINEYLNDREKIFFSTPFSLYDLNCDGEVNLADTGIFSSAFHDSTPDYNEGSTYFCSDYSHDGELTLADVSLFYQGFSGNGFSEENNCCVTIFE
ncbi:terpene cyclase/mutase family protein [archaeon]|jgi:hypothetical protein|nr:terpene cyclase/mutase family protein [archaeon]